MKLDKVYEEKVYAGVLGKLIGVYLGRPFEQWTHERILEEDTNWWKHAHNSGADRSARCI